MGNNNNLFMVAMTQIVDAIDALKTQLRDAAAREQSRYFAMPRLTLEQEKQAIESVYPNIEVTALLGDEAFTHCIDALSDFYVYDDNLSRRMVHKHPGVLVVPNARDFNRIYVLLLKINYLKDEFKSLIQQSGESAHEKWSVVHDKYNYIITMSVYRHINAYASDYDSAYFNWVTRPRSTRYQLDELIEKLRQSKAKTPLGKEQQQWETQINDEIEKCCSAGVDELVMRRNINYRPEVNLRVDGTMRSYSAGLPIILPSLPSKMSNLDSLNPGQRKVVKRQSHYQLVLPRLHVYAKASCAEV